MERGHDLVRREVSWSGPGATTLTEKAQEDVISCEESGDRTSPHGWEKEKEKHSWVRVKPALTSTASHPGRKTSKYLLLYLVYRVSNPGSVCFVVLSDQLASPS